MSLVQGIKKMAQGDVAGGLIHSFTGSIGNEVFEMARGNKSVGQGMAQIGTDVASAAVSFIPGIGPVAGAALKAGLSAANAAAQGGGAKDIALAGVTGAASNIGSGLLGKASGVIKEGASKVMSKLHIGGAKVAGYTGTLPDLDAAAGNIKQSTLAPVPGAEPPELRPKATLTDAQQAMVNSNTKQSFKSKVGKVAGQVGVQGVLSIASAIAGAKQASAANEVAKQSLLFQKQTYKDQKAETEKNKAKLKEDAWSDYSSASLFGSNLYGSESNNTLFTNYHVNNGTGNQGNFSILSAVPKNTDLT
jgi:hypothetical protein